MPQVARTQPLCTAARTPGLSNLASRGDGMCFGDGPPNGLPRMRCMRVAYGVAARLTERRSMSHLSTRDRVYRDGRQSFSVDLTLADLRHGGLVLLACP